MTAITTTAGTRRAPGRAAVRVGRVLTGLVGAFLLFDALIHVANIQAVVDASRTLGFDPEVMPFVGVLELVCLVLYVVPRTAPIGAVLLTGYLGGAFCAQLRIDAPVYSTLLFPIYVGAAIWIALYLRDQRVRDIVAGR